MVISIKEAFSIWQDLHQEYGNDVPAAAESWNGYTDYLQREGELTALQISHCPAFDDEMPEDDLVLVLEGLNTKVQYDISPLSDDKIKTYDIVVSKGDDVGNFQYSYVGSWQPDLPEIITYLVDSADAVRGLDFKNYTFINDLDDADPNVRKAFDQQREICLFLQRVLGTSAVIDLKQVAEMVDKKWSITKHTAFKA